MSGINSLFSCRNGLELAFAFDEIVSMGHKENVTLRDIQTHIEMESHEEKLANMIRQSKEREAQARDEASNRLPGRRTYLRPEHQQAI